jgi:DUF3102 family protein
MTGALVTVANGELMPPLQPGDELGFDYGSIDDVVVAEEMRSTGDRIRQRNVAAFIESGRDLIAIKERIEHGKFAAWVRCECGLTIGTAERMMAAARCIEKNDKLSYLRQRTLLLLTERSTPHEAIETISKRIEAGDRPSHKEIKSEIFAERERQKEIERQKAEERARRYERERRARRAGKRLSDEEHLAAEKRREERRAREIQKDVAQYRADVDAIATLLADCLQDRLSEFLVLFDKVRHWDIKASLSERARTAATKAAK